VHGTRGLTRCQDVAAFASSLTSESSKLPVHTSVIESRAIQLVFEYLTRHFHASETYFAHLIQFVVHAEDVAISMARDNADDDTLFETEEDNIFFEYISLVQFAAYHINELLTDSKYTADSALTAKRRTQLAGLLPASVTHLAAAVQWIKHAQVRTLAPIANSR
jgi:hypothetical protein